jgi:hypothetical protein
MSDLTPVLKEMAARPDATEMLMPHEIRRAGERRRTRRAMTTATGVVAQVAVAAGVLIRGITWDAASVGPAGQRDPVEVKTIHAPQDPVLTRPGRTGDLPPGTYRFTVTAAELVAHGLSRGDAHVYAGVWTWTLGDGRWSNEATPPEGVPPGTTGNHCSGYYDVVGDHIAFTRVTGTTSYCGPPTFVGTWSRARGGLQMRHFTGWGLPYLFDGKRWDHVSGPS